MSPPASPLVACIARPTLPSRSLLTAALPPAPASLAPRLLSGLKVIRIYRWPSPAEGSAQQHSNHVWKREGAQENKSASQQQQQQEEEAGSV